MTVHQRVGLSVFTETWAASNAWPYRVNIVLTSAGLSSCNAEKETRIFPRALSHPDQLARVLHAVQEGVVHGGLVKLCIG